MFKELFLESKINESVPREIQNLRKTLELILDHGYIKVGRKKFTKITGYVTNYFDDIIGVSLGPGMSRAWKFLNAPISKENFVFTGEPEYESTFNNLVNEFISGPYKFGKKYKGANYISDFEYADKVMAARPETKFEVWYQDNYDSYNPAITSVSQKSIKFQWSGGVTLGYPRGLSRFFGDYDVETTSKMSGDGMGHWYGEMPIKTDKQKEFYDMIKEFGF